MNAQPGAPKEPKLNPDARVLGPAPVESGVLLDGLADGVAETVAVPTLGDLCLIDTVDDRGQVTRLAAVHSDAIRAALVEELARPPSSSQRNEGPDRERATSHALQTNLLAAEPPRVPGVQIAVRY